MASGRYHMCNALKVRIMDAVFCDEDEIMTCREIADTLNIPLVNISRAMNNYKEKGCGYFRRLKPLKGKGKAFRYKLTEKGMKYYIKYCYRIRQGFDLNLNASKVISMPKREEIKRKKYEEFVAHQEEFERTGIQQPEKPKETWCDWVNLSYNDIADYTGITRHGALKMNLDKQN
jgi:hypothetical protein